MPAAESTNGYQDKTEQTEAVVTTIFPEYDWVREVLGDKADNAEVTMLLDNGVDLHSYQPTADDIVKISDCDLFIYVGGESDGWVDDALKNATNKNMKVINLLEVLGDSVKAEEVVEGMQETEHDHDHDHSKEVSTFEDDEVQDRSLSDWAGDWQSAYPFVLDGTLDDAFAAMAEKGEMTAKEYKTYYQNGYKTDISNINIEGDHIEFTYEDGKKVGSDYKYVGYYIQNWSTGTKAAMYRFEAETTIRRTDLHRVQRPHDRTGRRRALPHPDEQRELRRDRRSRKLLADLLPCWHDRRRDLRAHGGA